MKILIETLTELCELTPEKLEGQPDLLDDLLDKFDDIEDVICQIDYAQNYMKIQEQVFHNRIQTHGQGRMKAKHPNENEEEEEKFIYLFDKNKKEQQKVTQEKEGLIDAEEEKAQVIEDGIKKENLQLMIKETIEEDEKNKLPLQETKDEEAKGIHKEEKKETILDTLVTVILDTYHDVPECQKKALSAISCMVRGLPEAEEAVPTNVLEAAIKSENKPFRSKGFFLLYALLTADSSNKERALRYAKSGLLESIVPFIEDDDYISRIILSFTEWLDVHENKDIFTEDLLLKLKQSVSKKLKNELSHDNEEQEILKKIQDAIN